MNPKQKILTFDEPESTSKAPSWLNRIAKKGDERGSPRASDANGAGPDGATQSVRATIDPTDIDGTVDTLRSRAIARAREDAEAGIPEPESTSLTTAEVELRERCRSVFERWRSHKRQVVEAEWSEQEKSLSDKMGRATLMIDRIQRLTHELKRLKARLSMRRQEVQRELKRAGGEGGRGLSTRAYMLALAFLALVEYFANAPVFASLLPRDPLTERQIRLLSEVSEGWTAGAQRVIAQLAMRPDAALLAAGVVTFLCVLGHFFGRSMRDLVTHREQRLRRDTVTGRSPLEHVIPMVLTGLGLALVIGVLFESRVTLGEVGEQRYQDDISVVEELRRDAGWLRVDGDLLGANDRANRADDMEAVAVELKEYSLSMSRLSFPILLLNMCLVLCAICAAYFHRRVTRWEYFDDSKFEEDRKQCVEAVEAASEEITSLLGQSTKHVRELRGLLALHTQKQLALVAKRLDGVVELYRSENARSRGLEPHALTPFQTSPSLDLDVDGFLDADHALGTPDDYELEIRHLRDRFEVMRTDFNQEATG